MAVVKVKKKVLHQWSFNVRVELEGEQPFTHSSAVQGSDVRDAMDRMEDKFDEAMSGRFGDDPPENLTYMRFEIRRV